MAWLCIDAGTSVIKSVVFSDEGDVLCVARTSIAVSRPQAEMAEQDMEGVWQAVLDTSRRAVLQANVPISAVATTAQGDGVWLVDANGLPVRPAILWNDGRAGSIIERWRSDGVLEEGFKVSGSVSYPGLPNSIWRWLEVREPDSLSHARASLTCNSWLFLRLTGELAMDLSDASNPFCDIRDRQYSSVLLQLYGLEKWSQLLPPLGSAKDSLRELLPSVAAELNVPPGIPVVMAPYDIAATAWGSGCIELGQSCVILGTTICAEAIADDFGAPVAGTTLALDTTGTFLRAMPTLTGCEALSWLINLMRLRSFEELANLASGSAPGCEGVLFLPYLSPAGERSPFIDPHAKGSWSLLRLGHRDSHLVRSVYEGLSYVIRECLSVASGGNPSEVRICGGGAKSSFWSQMIADVCGCDVVRPEEEELGAEGAFLYGQVALGASSDLKAAFASMSRREQRFRPDKTLTAVYESGFQRFLNARDNAAKMWTSAGSNDLHG